MARSGGGVQTRSLCWRQGPLFTNVSVRGPICQCTAGFEQYNNGLNHFCPFAQGLAWPADAEPVGKAVRSSHIHPHANMHADDKRGKWSEGDTAGTCTRRSRRPCKSSSFQDALQNTRYRCDGSKAFFAAVLMHFITINHSQRCVYSYFSHTRTHTRSFGFHAYMWWVFAIGASMLIFARMCLACTHHNVSHTCTRMLTRIHS